MRMKLAVATTLFVIAGCAADAQEASRSVSAAPTPVTAAAKLQPTAGNQASGEVKFSQRGDKVMVTGQVMGLTPGAHGFHIHEKGDCGSPDATSAGGHYNPTNKPHGAPDASERHGGDLGNLNADASGRATVNVEVAGITVAPGPNSIIGKGLIVHADPDDFKTQPTGNSGKRVACGVIG